MNRALWLLLGLQMRGWLRYIGRNLATLRGALLALVGVLVFVPWMIGVLLAPAASGLSAYDLRRYGPAMLVLYCLANVIFSSHERALYFTPAEVQFLFTGPFSRRAVLAYKLMLTFLVSLPATLILGLVLRVKGAWMPAVLLGLFFVSIFMQLFSTSLGLIANSVNEQLYSRGRKLALLVAVVVGLLIFAQARGPDAQWQPDRLRDQIFETTAWRIVSHPLRAFFDVMVAKGPAEMAWPLMVALAVNVGLVALVFFLDAQYQEAAAAVSARIYARLQRLRGRHVDSEGAQQSRSPRWEVPGLPYWGGVGPIFWRQLTSALRGSGRLIFVLFIVAVAIVAPMLGAGMNESQSLLPGILILGVWLSVFLTSVVPFDFRGDIDRMAILKTLPIAPWRLALGQLLTPTLLLSLMQWLTLVVAWFLSPDNLEAILVVAVFVVPYSFYLVALENLLFLLFPVRLMAATPGDFQALGRNVLLAVGKMLGLMIVAGMALFAGLLAALLGGGRMWIGVAAAWPVVVLAGAVLVPLVGLAFMWFDVGRDTPA